MKKFVLFLICVFLLCGCGSASISGRNKLQEILISSKEYADVVDLAKNVASAIVGVSSVGSSEQSVGSGVCVAKGGYILTNSHVIISDDITLYLANGNTSDASLVWSDDSQDIAILKAKETLPYLSLSADDDIQVGQDVVAVGTPLSLLLKHSFTKGIVSALNRTLKVQGNGGECYMQNLIQHDASLNPGNSGGPLLNLKGEVIGINTLKISGGEGIGFAIPVKSISSLLSKVIASKQSVSTPYLGAYGFDAEIAKFNDLTPLKTGFYIEKVSENSPLYSAGVRDGCVITKLNGREINNALDLRNELYKHSDGDDVSIGYFDGEKHVLSKIKLSKK